MHLLIFPPSLDYKYQEMIYKSKKNIMFTLNRTYCILFLQLSSSNIARDIFVKR